MPVGGKRNVLYCSGFFSLPTSRELVSAARKNSWVLNSVLYQRTHEGTYTGGIQYDAVISHLNAARTKALVDHLGPIPHVSLNPEIGVAQGIPCVSLDHLQAGRTVGRHFLDLGFTQFAAICHAYPNHLTFQLRARGLSEVVEAAGLPPVQTYPLPERYREDYLAEDEAYRRIVLSLPLPVALAPLNDRIANVLINVCRREDLLIPSQVSICGFDNDPIACELAPIPLSSVDTGHVEQARRAAETLRQMLDGVEVPLEPQFIRPKGVKVRSTSGLPAQASRPMAEALAFIHQAIDDPDLAVPDIARAIRVSERSLYNAFRREMDTSPLKYLVSLRVTKAKGLIESTRRKVKEIRRECGFSSDYQMYMAFKRCTGQSPASFRA